MPSPCLPRTARLIMWVCASVLPLGCVGNTIVLLDDDGGSSAGSDDTTTSTTAPPTVSTTIPEPADDTSTPGTDTTGISFLPEPDGGGVAFECDLFEQDCPPGEKCMPWSNDGGSAWNATRCSPIADDPAGPGEPCMVEGSGVSGLDDCELGAMCWDVDPETMEGTCMPFCVGSANDPYCEDPSRYCAISGDGVLILCVPTCNPIEQDCPDGSACYPVHDYWTCAPDASGELGAYGDPCEFINVCDPGLVCLGSAAVPPGEACEGAAGCCSEICDIADPLGDAQCTGAAGGQTCQAWYEEGTAPQGYEDVGVCALPQ